MVWLVGLACMASISSQEVRNYDLNLYEKPHVSL
jgi:hypothetical protein